MQRRLLILIAGLSLASVAHADVPLPKNLQYIDPRVQFDGVGNYPDQVFYLRFLTFSGGPSGVPYRLMPVKDAMAFNLNAQRRLESMQLIAIPKSDFEKRVKDDPTLKWLDGKTEGVLRADLETPSTVESILKKVPTTIYRVQIKDGKLTASRAAVKSNREGEPPIWLAGLFGSFAIAAAGLWLARRQ